MSVEAHCHLTHIDFWSISPPVYNPLDPPLKIRCFRCIELLSVFPLSFDMQVLMSVILEPQTVSLMPHVSIHLVALSAGVIQDLREMEQPCVQVHE